MFALALALAPVPRLPRATSTSGHGTRTAQTYLLLFFFVDDTTTVAYLSYQRAFVVR